jgi:coenzyme F420-reducing hydrogenase alpha subunit
MLHAPDFLGYPDAVAMAKDHPDLVQRALKLKKIGNELVILMAGREVHPINIRLGGFYRAPTPQELKPIEEKLKWARDMALETVRWTAGLPMPDFEQDYTFVALRHPDEYPFNEGRLVSNKGLDIPIREYDDHFEEEHMPHSNALHSFIRDQGAYMVGPMARYNVNFDRLSPLAKEAAQEAGLGPTCFNPFKSIILRSVEVVYACDEALRIIDSYKPPDRPHLGLTPKTSTGYGCTEAPRGILYNRYSIDENGKILDAKIVPPTAQNQKTIENDLYHYVDHHKDLPKDELTHQCEQAIRNYDPCISCATHFLKLDIDRDS